MKKLIYLLILAMPLFAQAKICKGLSKKAQKYNQQSQWKHVDLNLKNSPIDISGLIDQNDQLHLNEISFNGPLEASMEVDSNSKYYKYFNYYCSDPEKDPGALGTLRETQEGASITVNLPYLSQLDDKSMNLAELNTSFFELYLDYDADAMVNQAYSPKKLKLEIQKNILAQLEKGMPLGSYKFDLTHLDDFACDLLHGKARISIYRKIAPKEHFTVKEDVVDKSELQSILKTWNNIKAKHNNFTETVFLAGASYQKLKDDGTLKGIDNDKAMDIFEEIVEPMTGTFKTLSGKETQCLLDSLQEFRTELVYHRLTIQFQFDKDKTLGN